MLRQCDPVLQENDTTALMQPSIRDFRSMVHSPQADQSGKTGVRHASCPMSQKVFNKTNLLLQRKIIIIVHCLDAIRSSTTTVLYTSSVKDH